MMSLFLIDRSILIQANPATDPTMEMFPTKIHGTPKPNSQGRTKIVPKTATVETSNILNNIFRTMKIHEYPTGSSDSRYSVNA
jgi:hypothetical protein